MTIHFIDAGQGDATLFELDSGETLLFDTGDYQSDDVVDYLGAQGIEEIDILVGSHPHADHIGQMDLVLEQLAVDEVWLSGAVTSSNTFERVLDAVDGSGAVYEEPRAGDVFDLGPLEIDVLHPSSLSGNLNDDSLAVRMVYGEVSVLLTGDVEASGEEAMLSRGKPVDADIFQLGHHGSNTSTTQAFLDAVSPETAIVSYGADNSYGHPHAEVVERVEASGADLYGTADHGTIVVTTDGADYTVETGQDGGVEPQETEETLPEEEEEQPEEADSGGAAGTVPAGCVDINYASAEELEAIQHIGPERAEQILSLRPFGSVEELTRVDGIAEGRLADILAEGKACAGGAAQ
ncbi:MBL fold metallo-hydrolase [Alkalicoccus urumqiensis]|uniref:MBL fold metallo-hydrolase n=2 Tax=Alkalicoccus urumqiensis TaxID=1548213 RepID=A0A2P6MK89_ALKUR|nr:MBL fold metallo-hydrolase [Alkalicoccus urumqiensis]